jgi:hypothetical protein
LIARKQEVRRQLEQAERRQAALQERPAAGLNGWWLRRRQAELVREIERLMAEEGMLRLAIDRAKSVEPERRRP